jgi:(2Fe-2S) ferredoxin
MKNRNTILIGMLSACFALCQVQAAVDTPDPGGKPVSNTADGQNALLTISTGIHNSAFGFDALLSNTDANFNTAVGSVALLVNDGSNNTAVGAGALLLNSTGGDNCAVGTFALFNSTTPFFNNAVGHNALFTNSTGSQNNAMGDSAMFGNDTGSFNTAIGDDALDGNVSGGSNVAIGDEAGTTIVDGSNNTCVGAGAGNGIVHSSDIIAIGAPATGIFADFGPTCFIGGINEPTGDPGSTVAVLIDSNNNLGTSFSSRRFKHDIKPMDKASEALLALKPVSFKYNHDVKGSTQYGLIAEEVAQVDPQLVVYRDGEPITVKYDQINVMLLSEFLKEHKKVEEQQASIGQLKSEMQTMVAQLKEQAAQIQKVSARLEVNKPAPQVVANKP